MSRSVSFSVLVALLVSGPALAQAVPDGTFFACAPGAVIELVPEAASEARGSTSLLGRTASASAATSRFMVRCVSTQILAAPQCGAGQRLVVKPGPDVCTGSGQVSRGGTGGILGDGSVRSVGETIDDGTLGALAGRGEGNTTTGPTTQSSRGSTGVVMGDGSGRFTSNTIDSRSFSEVTDGTSNTISARETSTTSSGTPVCGNTGIGAISDGTSNTIGLGETGPAFLVQDAGPDGRSDRCVSTSYSAPTRQVRR